MFQLAPRFILDLVKVKDIAEIFVNGKLLGILWKTPYQIEISGALKAGANKIEVKITNQWTNRIVGDAIHPDKKKLDGAGLSFGTPNKILIESGLIGPVILFAK